MIRAELMIYSLLTACCLSSVASAQPRSLQPNSARNCTVCHIERVESFDQPEAVLLIDRPLEPMAAEGDTCLGCHDGSVADSRRRVWLEHGHQTGIIPPPDIHVPEQLPLKDGRIACRTCHTAHSNSGPETIANAIFLRVRNDASQMCQLCHTGHGKGPGLGTHPVGGMPWPVPDALIAAGARVGPEKQRLICQTCHTPHGAREDHLLVMGTEGGQLCLTCHAKLRPGFWRPDTGHEHPQNPPLSSDAQRQAIKDMGTKTGTGETLICLSCHKLHHGKTGRSMLADTLQDSALCLRCHPGRATIFGTQHDLRVSAPNERNRLGQSVEDSGPCGACHSFHQFARLPAPQKLDPTGLCTTCHRQGQCANKATGMPFSHPTDIKPENITAPHNGIALYPKEGEKSADSLACLTCHDPHETRHPHFMRAEPDSLCSACHGEKVNSIGHAHDFTRHPELKNARGQTALESGKCGFCHGVHNANGPALWIATSNPPDKLEDWCLACHQSGGLANKAAPPLLHPLGSQAGAHGSAIHLPLFDNTGCRSDNGSVTCASCHDPHSKEGTNDFMLRLKQGNNSDSYCFQCHADQKSVLVSLHSRQVLGNHFDDTRFCAPCHAVHAKPGMVTNDMWAAPTADASLPADNEKCLGCHSKSGGVKSITPTVHPPVALQNIEMNAVVASLPLFNQQGKPDPNGVITCRTCHLPHGRMFDSTPLEQLGAETPLKELTASRPMVRSYTAPNLCSTCHGSDGLRLFLYYHDPIKRRPKSQLLSGSEP